MDGLSYYVAFGAFTILFGGFYLWIAALISIRKRSMDGLVQILWVLFVTLMPIVGALAYFAVNPGQQSIS